MRNFKAKLTALLMTISCFAVCLVAGVAIAMQPQAAQVTVSAATTYTTYTFNKLSGANGCTDSVVYAYPTDGDALPTGDWDNRFTLENGEGLKLNGTELEGWEIKQPGDFYIVLNATAVAGDELTINGTFINEATAKKFVFNNCILEFDGTTWITGTSYTTYTFNKLSGANGCTDSVVYAYPTAGDTLPTGDWDNRFTLQKGEGLKLNETVLQGWEIKQPGDLYIVLNATAVAGDELTINGTFINKTTAKKFVFNDCVLVYNGTTWITGVEYTTYNLGKVQSIVDASNADGYLTFATGVELPVNSWADAFKLYSGNGITMNDTPVDYTNNIKSVGGKLFVTFTTPASKDSVLVIGGTFYNEALAIKYVVEESAFKWNGSTWEEVTIYETYNLGKVQSIVDASNANGYLTFATGVELPVSSWTDAFMLDSGVGITMNGTPVDYTNNIKSVGGKLFVTFTTPASKDSVLVIGGTFYNEALAIKYVVEESAFKWNGSTWEEVTLYETHNLGKVQSIADASNANGYLTFATGVELPVSSWDYAFAFMLDSGVGITMDGEPVDYDNNIKSIGGRLYVTFTTPASKDSVLVIGGTFYNEALAIKYVVEESKFTWNGSAWEAYKEPIAYTTYEIGKLTVSRHSSGGANAQPAFIYLDRKDGAALPVQLWANPFTKVAGDGLTLNGAEISFGEMQSAAEGIFLTFAEVQKGDTLSISGTFACPTQAVKYVIEESKFTWNGTAWENYIDYYTQEVGKLTYHDGNATSVYLKRADGVALEIATTENDLHWTTAFAFEADSGVGITLNRTQISMNDVKFPQTMYIGLGTTVKAGDILVVEGTFYSTTLAYKYVIQKSVFVFDGTTWSDMQSSYTISNLKPTASSTANAPVYLKINGNTDLPVISDYTFAHIDGAGFVRDGAQLKMTAIKSTADGFNFKFAKSSSIEAGQEFTLSGTFYCEDLDVTYIIEECKIKWTGSVWKTLENYTISDLIPTSASTKKAVVYLKINGDTALPVINDTHEFVLQEGAGLVTDDDGTQFTMASIKSTADGFNFTIRKAGNIAEWEAVTLSGTFYCAELDVTYIIEECKIMWTGSVWKKYIPYTTYTFNALSGANGCTADVIYAYPTDGDDLPTGDWDNRFTLESGEGLKLNDTVLEGWEIKQPGDLYIVLGKTAVQGDVFTIDGTFVNETIAKKFVFNNCQLEFNGTTWVTKSTVPVVYETHNLGALVLHANSSIGGASGLNNVLYLQRADGEALPVLDWNAMFTDESGEGFKIKGKSATAYEIKSTGDGFFWSFDALSAGDEVSISGTFVCDAKQVKYVIEESSFVWTGSGWALLGKDYSDLIEGVVYDTVTIVDLGFGVEENVTGLLEGAGLDYWQSEANTTGSIKFRLGLKAENISAGVYDIRFRGTEWDGIRFIIGAGVVKSYYLQTRKTVPLSSNTYYEIEIGIIDTADGNSIWIYAKVDGVLYISDLVEKTQNKYDDAEGKQFSEYTSNRVSIYGNMGTATLYDPDRSAITYTTDCGTSVAYVDRNKEYTLPQGKTYYTFIGWWDAENEKVYAAGQTIMVTDAMSLEAITLDFSLEDGAAIRLSDNINDSGIRFTTLIKAADLAALEGYGITVNSYGTLIMPFDYLGRDQAPNLSDFDPNANQILKLESTYQDTADGNVIYRGAMNKLKAGNYARLFAGRGYMELTVNGETIIIYTPFDMKDNVRSMRSVAYRFQGDKGYGNLSSTKKGVVDTYAASNEINLMNYTAYGNNNFLHLIAWYYPELDPSNAYNNETNIAIATKIKAAGMTAVYLDGEYHLDLNKAGNVEKTRQIIKFFWEQGLYTIAFGSNASTNLAINYTTEVFPDFSDCEGFMGYLVWDEPASDSFGTLAAFANNFESVYAGTDTMFMANLLPSYATQFNKGSTGWWDSSLDKLNKDAYKAYVESYCTTVLSQVKGEKWLSMDSYPINADQSLTGNFLFDLAVLKYYAMTYDAHAHAVLQSSGWTEDDNTSKNRMPTEAEMRMQAYAAMAFGVDSISWWSYSDKRNDNQHNPTDNDDYYTRFANVNKELSSISAIYSAFDWKGVILGVGKDNGNLFNPDEDYEAYNIVKGQIGAYELSASKTKLLSGVSTNKTNWNYLMGVMEDMNGNEAYVLCNYNSHEENRDQTITLTFSKNVTKVVIFRGGVQQTVPVSNNKLAISLATGEGVIVLPAEIG